MRIDKTIINQMNKHTVIDIIRRNSPVYKAEISRISSLSLPTIMKITSELTRIGLVREVGKAKSTGGKPPQLLEFVSDSHYIVGVDIGATNLKIIVMDLSAKILSKTVVPTGARDEFNRIVAKQSITDQGKKSHEDIIEKIIYNIEKSINDADIDQKKLLGIGIGMPGLHNLKEGIVKFSPDFGWENVNLVLPLRKRFNLPITFDNVTRAMAMGELYYGMGQGALNFISIGLGFGIGAALVIDGELYSGKTGTAGEIGHMVMENSGPLCDCGNYGCLEAVASGNAIAREAKSAISRGKKTSIINMVNGDINRVEAKTVFDAAKSGDKIAIEITGKAIEYMGIAIASAINLFDPELIILEGGIAEAGDYLLDKLSEVVWQRKMRYASENIRIAISKMGSNAASIGAASFIFKALVESGGMMPRKLTL